MKFTLRKLLLFIAFACITMAIIIHRVDNQRRLVATLESRGVNVGYDNETMIWVLDETLGPPTHPKMYDWHHSVTSVSIRMEHYDTELKCALRQLHNLKRIYLVDAGSAVSVELIAVDFPESEIIDVDQLVAALLGS